MIIKFYFTLHKDLRFLSLILILACNKLINLVRRKMFNIRNLNNMKFNNDISNVMIDNKILHDNQVLQ